MEASACHSVQGRIFFLGVKTWLFPGSRSGLDSRWQGYILSE